LQATKYTVYPLGGGAYHVGGLSSAVTDSTGLMSFNYNLADINALQFLTELADVVGNSATYGDAAATSFFSAATLAPLSTMRAELAMFAESGAKSSADGGALASGLSTTAPHTFYQAYLSDGTGTGTWDGLSTIASANIASAIRGLFRSSGATATVSAMIDWLADFTPNPANATPATNTPQQTLNGITGTYDPDIAPATTLQATAPFMESTGALYNLASLGFLATALASISPSTLRNGISVLSPGEPFSVSSLDLRYLGPLGRAGLSLQPRSSATTISPNVTLAANFGNVYRQLRSL
jgi:hypothetical protein